MKFELLKTMEKHLESKIDFHCMNLMVLLENPRIVPEHTDVMSSISEELGKISEYHDKLEVLNKYFLKNFIS